MKKRITIILAVLSALLLGVGCGSHSSYWQSYQLTGHEDDPGYPEDYYWVEGVADMGRAGELTLCWVTLAESREAQVVCSLARNQMRGNAAIYWEDPEGELTRLFDMSDWSSGSNNGSCALPKGTSRFLVRADKGKYDVGVGISGLGKENVLYLDELAPLEDLPSLR